MISFDLKTTFEELLSADPSVINHANACLTLAKSYPCRPGFDGSKAEIVLHIPIVFDPTSVDYKTAITTELKTQNARKQTTPLMIFTDAETGERLIQDPNVPKGQGKLF